MNFIDLFSGVGGFTRGMELAGHECAGHCEFDKYAEIVNSAVSVLGGIRYYIYEIVRSIGGYVHFFDAVHEFVNLGKPVE